MPDPFLEVYRHYTGVGMAKDSKTLFSGRHIKLQVGDQSVLVKLGRIIMRQTGIIGRNTCVVEGTSAAWPGRELAVKISWPASSWVPENTFVDEIKRAAEAQEDAAWVLDHIPTILHAEDFPLLPDSPGYKLREYLSGRDDKSFDDKVFNYELRVCRVTVHERLQPLDALTTPEDYAQVIFDVFQVHCWIYDHPRIMHRDLSQGNIMWHRRRGRICGVLNDFDLSSYRDKQDASSWNSTLYGS
ncbi:hypothetical protein BDZ89DRAFT_56159 [Hymenopellis radicata]|nr:hypothetical protein BDZ89DRAFT_56159 [Hymenopellis radicata]